MYTVIFEIEVDGNSHMEAALEVERIMKNPLYRPSLKVTDKSGKSVVIDLDNEDNEPLKQDDADGLKFADGLVFTCPSCEGHRLECCEDGAYNSEVLNIDKDGDFDYGEINASGQVERFQCLKCGFVLESKEEGFARYTITDNEEVVTWIEKNCEQPEEKQ